MALHPDFPRDSHAILDPALRWFPADEALRTSSFEKLLPPLVPKLHKEVKAWRDRDYAGAADTSRSLLRWWFQTEHLVDSADGIQRSFAYFFVQREALETIIVLYDVVDVKDELELLRKQANEIDAANNPFKAIVSVLMLKEGWDVRNVTTIVGLRAYTSKSNILPEQTLGRGLRKMYPGAVDEFVSVVGTNAFMEFVESIQAEGVVLERRAMGEETAAVAPIVVEIDHENPAKDIDRLDIEVPILSARVYREYKNLNLLDIAGFGHAKIPFRHFSEQEQREIIFKDIVDGKATHTTVLDSASVADYRSALGHFAHSIMKDLRLVSGYDVLYAKVKSFVRDELFEHPIDLDDPNTLRNLSELGATKTLLDNFKKAINALTIQDKGNAEIRDRIKLRQTRPFVAKDQGFLISRKCVFNRIIGDSQFELEFAAFLESCDDIVSFAKNYLAVGFKLDYVNAAGDISNYYPDFLVKTSATSLYIVETKGLEDLDVPLKLARLRQWCADVNAAQPTERRDFVFVDEEAFHRHRPTTFAELVANFRRYKEAQAD